MSKRAAALVGGAIGLTITLYAIVYLPMSANYSECGKVTLCP